MGSGNNSVMNILMMTDRFLPHAGGSRVYYYNLYSRLVERHPDRVTILTKKVPGWEQFDLAAERANLHIIRHFRPLPDLHARHLPKILFPLGEAFARVAGGGVNIIHAGDLYPPGLIAVWLKKIFGLPYLAYCHGEDITLTEHRRFQRPVRNMIYRNANAVVAACEFARQHLLQIGLPESRIFKITPGVDWERFAPRPVSESLRRKLGIGSQIVVLTVARLTPRKGHANVLRAFARVLPHVPDAAYLIVGTGPERESLERLAAELGIAHAVRFTGYVAEEELGDYYNLCDIFAMINQETDGDIEGFGMVFLEANAAGKPVLGGRSGGTADSILDGETGFLIDPLAPDQLAENLRALLESRELRMRLGQAGLRRAQADFSWSTRADMLHEISLAMMEGSRKARKMAEASMTSHGV